MRFVTSRKAIYFNKLIIFSFTTLIFFASFSFASCRSLHEPKSVYTRPVYTEKDVYENEKKRIAKLAETEPLEALWNATLLGDEETITLCVEKSRERYEKSIEEKNYLDALMCFRSLKAANVNGYDFNGISEEALLSLVGEGVPGLSVDEQDLPKTIADCINATVTVWVDRGIAIKDGRGYADTIIGSGFFIDKKGYIVTNHHVIADLVNPRNESYARLYIRLAADSETRIPARVVGYDDVLDLALLKAEIDAPFVLALGSSSDLAIGDRVSAIGTPLGLGGTLTQGVVSAVGRKLLATGDVLQIDAAVNAGNSGGPLIDSNMRVQAIVFAGLVEFQGLNFAIPVEYLRQDLPILYRGGKRTHSWTGSYGRGKKSGDGRQNLGLEVQYVMPGGSAYRASLTQGDVITSLDGTPVDSLESMQNILRGYTPGTIVKCSYTRGEEAGEKLLYLNARPENPGYEIYQSDLITGSFVPIFGMRLASASTTSRRAYTIVDVIRGSIADESGFSENDPINIARVDFNDDGSVVYVSLYTRRRKKGFLDISMMIPASLDSPYYF